jgi:hypothetical protein
MPATEHIEKAAEADRLLRALGARLAVAAPPSGALDRLTRRASATRRQLLWSWVLVVICALVPVAMAWRGELSAVASLTFLITAAATGLTLLMSTRQQAMLERLRVQPGDLFEDWRRDLQGRIRSTVASAIFSGVFGICLLGVALLRPFTAGQMLLVLTISAALLFGGLRAVLVELRDLRAERQMLDESGHA